MNYRTLLNLALGALVVFTVTMGIADDKQKKIDIAKIDRKDKVDFEKEILPILRRNCLACHNSTEHEGGLVLETPKTILKGGESEGPAALPGKGTKSVLLLFASGQSEDSMMPPADNDVGAKPLTPQELGLIKLWIDQGAKGEVKGGGPIAWQPLPAGVNPIYSVAIDADGQYAAAGRANQVFLHHVPSGQQIGRLTDPSLLKKGSIYSKPGVAMLDLIQSMAFAPNGHTLAVGGYRTVKFWQRPTNVVLREGAKVSAPVRSVSYNPAGSQLALGLQNGQVQILEVATGKLQRTLAGHKGPVNGVGFSADGKTLVSGSDDKTLRSWNVATGKQIASVMTPAAIKGIAMVAKATQVAAGSDDKMVRIWAIPAPLPTPKAAPKKADDKKGKKGDAKKKDAKPVAPPAPKPIRELKGHGAAITSLAALGPAQLVSGSKDGTARIWDVKSGKQVRSLAHGGPVEALAVRPDGKRVVTASSNKVAKLFDAANGKLVAELRGSLQHKLAEARLTRQVALAAKVVANAKKDLDAAKKRKTAEDANKKKADDAKKKSDVEYKKKDDAAKKAVKTKADADQKVVAANKMKTEADKAKKTVDAEVAKQPGLVKVAQAAFNTANAAATKAAAATKKTLAALNATKEAAKKDPKQQGLKDAIAIVEAAVKTAQAAQVKVDQGKVAAQTALAAAKKKSTDLLAKKKVTDKAVTTAAAAIKTAMAATKKLAAPTKKATDEKVAAKRAQDAAARSVVRAQQAVKKAAGAIPPIEVTIKTLDAAHKAETAKLTVAKKATLAAEVPIVAVSFSKDGKTVATVDQGSATRTWSGETGKAIESYVKAGFKPTAVVFTADNQLLTFADNNSSLVWNTRPQWKLVRTIGNASTSPFVDRVTSLAYSRDGQLLATGSGEPSRSGEIKIWKVADGSLVREIKEPHSDSVFAIEFSRDGKFIASCAADRFVKVFNVADGKFVRSFEGHTHHVLGVSWSADGRMLASSGADKQVKIWDFRTGDQRRSIGGFGKEVTSIRFAGDKEEVIVASGDKNVYIKRTSNGGNVASLTGASDYVYSVSVSDDGATVIAGGQDSVLRVWDAKGKSIITFSPPAPSKANTTAATGG